MRRETARERCRKHTLAAAGIAGEIEFWLRMAAETEGVRLQDANEIIGDMWRELERELRVAGHLQKSAIFDVPTPRALWLASLAATPRLPNAREPV